MNNLVYHYTSLKTLFNIIENAAFFLTDLHSSMDINELKYAENIIKEAGKKVLNIDTPFFVPANNYYALSCTKLGDSYFHFNNYGDNCTGVAIGISRDFLSKSKYGQNAARLLGVHLSFADVLYDPKLQKYYVEQSIKSDCEGNKLLNYRALTNAYNYYLSRIKRSEFQLENEVRFVYRQDYHGSRTTSIPLEDGSRFMLDDFLSKIGLEKTTTKELCNIKYGYFNNRIIKYYEFGLKEFGLNNVIKSIVIGPKSKQDKNELNDYFKSKGLEINIIESEIELRD